MTRDSIGEFEHLILLAVLRLGSEAYGVPICDEVRRHSGRKVLRPAVYVSLSRLEEKGLISSRREAAQGRRGRPRKYVEVTAAGLATLRDSRDTLLSMWDGIETALNG